MIERSLIVEGAIKQEDDESYRILSHKNFLQETYVGTFAEKGDFITVNTVNGKQYPCLNRRKYFMETHQHIEGNEYDQLSKPVGVWFLGDPVSPELQYIAKSSALAGTLLGMISINRGGRLIEYDFHVWSSPIEAIGDTLCAGCEATIIFYNVKRDETGKIVHVDFEFIERDVFNREYVFCDTQEEHKK